MQFEIHQLSLSAGSEVTFSGIDEKQLEYVIEELGDHRNSRLAYNRGLLTLMAPSAEHEYDKTIIGNFVETLLDALEVDFIGLGSVTLKHSAGTQAVEPDECYYIQNVAQIRGKSRIDLKVDPPPDLVLEVDITSKTNLEIYEVLKIPEVWCYNQEGLTIYLLQESGYVFSLESLQFPDFPIILLISRFVEQSKFKSRRIVMKDFQAWIHEVMKKRK